MIRLLVEVGNFNYYTATQSQFEAWTKRHGYKPLGPSEAYPNVALWVADGKPLLRAQELRPLTTAVPEPTNA